MKIAVRIFAVGALLASTEILAQPAPAAQPTDLFVLVEKPGWTNTTQYSWTGAWGDYDKDGYIDLFVANCSVAGSPSPSWMNFVYRNNGDGTFTPKFAAQVGPIASDKDITQAGYWGDFNNDGQFDLFALNGLSGVGGPAITHRLYLNQGGGKFACVNAGDLTKPAYNWGCGAVADYDNDGCLDVFLCEAFLDNGRRTNRLFQGRGDGTFRVVTDNAVVTNRLTASFSNDAVWGDFDNDGDQDLIVANHDHRDFFFRNEGEGQFTRLANNVLSNPGYETGHHAWGDYDNDGFLDIASGGGGPARLFHNNGNGDFNVVTNWTAASHGTPVWADYDNDGHLDLLIVRGQGGPMQRHLFHNNGDGTFDRVEDAITRKADTWLAAPWGDYDNDGFMDLFGTTTTGKNVLYHNQGNTNHWIKFVLEGRASNGAAIGAKVRVKATIGGKTVWQMREVSGGNMCQNDLRPNFGLGDATVAEVIRIEWPSGNVRELVNQPADRVVKVAEWIVIQPVRPTASLGASVTLTNLSSLGTYQWRFNGVGLPGETNRTLELTNLQAAHQGRYSVVVTASSGTITTNFAYLTVDPTFTKITTGPVPNDPEGGTMANWIDYDQDGHLDLYVERDGYHPPLVYHHNGDGSFARVRTGVLAETAAQSWCTIWADYDNDGQVDLFVPNHGSVNDMLFHNEGGGNFTRIRTGPVVSDSRDSLGAAFVDYDRDGFVDLFVPTYSRQNDLFYGNNGDGTFRRLTAADLGPIVNDAVSTGTILAVDVDNDGIQEISRTIDTDLGSTNQLWGLDQTGRYVPRDIGDLADAIQYGGVNWADYDNDGFQDAITGVKGVPFRLFRNLQGQGFTNVTASAGLPPVEAYYAVWSDYDNDGWLDFFMMDEQSGGHVFCQNNGDGTFTTKDVGSPLRWYFSLVPGDYNNDGFLDLFTANFAGVHCGLFLNNGNANHWLKVRLDGRVSNRSGIGAMVRAYATIKRRTFWQMREISGQEVGLGNGLVAHFGLGDATKTDVLRIEWPSGIVQELTNVVANQILTVTEPPRLESLGQGRLRILCWARQQYEIEASNDLDTWTSLGLVATDVNRPEVVDPAAATHPHRFYRAVQR